MKYLRLLLLFGGTGLAWYFALNLFFVWSGAQGILSNPRYQSGKFIKVFTAYAPLPRMATDSSIAWKGLLVVGALLALAFLLINKRLGGNWFKKGLTFGIIHWLIMTPWFEFYLPYNVMHEPLLLVLFEAILWLAVALTTGSYMSFTVNLFKKR